MEPKSIYPSIPHIQYERILNQLNILERLYNIKIIYAVENGSRLTGLWHDESDFDIRFVFTFNRKCLNTTNGRKMMDLKDTIEGCSEDGVLDWQGWTIDKAIDCLKCSNTSIIEWVNSDIVYQSDNIFLERSRKIVGSMFNNKSLYYHYLNMAKKNWEMHIKDKKIILYKKYLYVIRPLLMLMYIESKSYEKLKSEMIIVNDFYKLLQIIKDMDEYHMSTELLAEIDYLVDIKQTNKGYEGPPLICMNEWILAFFELDNKKMIETKQAEHIVLQGLQSTREKLIHELKKTNTIGLKTGIINRTDYLSLFGQYTMYIWLIQHPDKTSSEAPQNIGNLIKEIEIDDELKEWIHHIITTKKEICLDEDLHALQNMRISTSNIFLIHLQNYLVYLKSTTDDKTDPEIVKIISEIIQTINDMMEDMTDGKVLPRDDIFEHCFRNYLTVLWLIRSDQNARNVPKDIFSDKENKDVIPSKLLAYARTVVSDLRPTYSVIYDKKYHELIQKDIIDTEEYYSKITAKYQRKKEIDKQAMYKGSFETVDPIEFLSFLEIYL